MPNADPSPAEPIPEGDAVFGAFRLIRELGRAHSVILSTHILTEVEAVCDRVQILHHGEVVFSNTIAGLREFQRGRTVTISLHRPPAIETLRGIDGISTVEDGGNGRFLIRFAPDVDPTATLVARAGAEDWGLNQLTPAQTSLEDVFVHLTRGESAAENAGENAGEITGNNAGKTAGAPTGEPRP